MEEKATNRFIVGSTLCASRQVAVPQLEVAAVGALQS